MLYQVNCISIKFADNERLKWKNDLPKRGEAWVCQKWVRNAVAPAGVCLPSIWLSPIVSGIENKCNIMPEFFLPICQCCNTAAKWTLAKRNKCKAIAVIITKNKKLKRVAARENRGNHVWKLHLFLYWFAFVKVYRCSK